MEILGSPIGDAVFCSQFVAKKHKGAMALLSAIERIGTIDPQVALILLRSCASFCKPVNITRATPPSLISSALESYDATIRHTFAECTGVYAADVARDQAQLSTLFTQRGLWAPLFSAPFSSSLHCIFVHCH